MPSSSDLDDNKLPHKHQTTDTDELFLVTHKKRSANWVDNRSQRTNDSHHQSLSQIQTQVDETSPSGMQEVDGSRKLDLWQEDVGGRTRGQCYGTTHLSLNLRRGMSSLTQESQAPSGRIGGSEGEEKATRVEERATRAEERAARAREMTARAEEMIARAREMAARAEERAARVEARYVDLEGRFRAMMERMTALERQSRGGSCSASQPPHYDNDLDDHSLDEASPDGRHR